jgi:hypothetical protein
MSGNELMQLVRPRQIMQGCCLKRNLENVKVAFINIAMGICEMKVRKAKVFPK